MEETIKVSIGGISFAVNKDAYQRLSLYIKDLENHYSTKPEGKEIINDIESRIAELLLEGHTKDEVVSAERVDEVIKIMGRPSDFDEEEQGEKGSETKSTFQARPEEPATGSDTITRRLFRDTTDRVIGGVCSGLAHYFKISPVWVRLFFAIFLVFKLFKFGFFFHFRSFVGSISSLMILTYIVLWIVIPEARTRIQKSQMFGRDPGVKGVEDEYNNPDQPHGKWLGRLIKIFIGLILLLIAFGLLGAGWFAFLGSNKFFGVTPVSIMDYLQMPWWWGLLGKISAVLFIVLPILALTYAGIWLIFSLKRPKWHPGLIMFALWILSIIGLSVFSSDKVFNMASSTSTFKKEFVKSYDTLYVEYAKLPETLDGEKVEWMKMADYIDEAVGKNRASNYVVDWDVKSDNGEDEVLVNDESPYDRDYLLYTTSGKKNKKYALYPKIHVLFKNSSSIVTEEDSLGNITTKIVKDETITPDLEVTVEKILSSKKFFKEGDDEEAAEKLVEIRDSLIILHPNIASKKRKFDGALVSTKLFLPDSSVVIIK